MQTENERKSGAVSHPNQEEWMSWLYGETPRAGRTQMAAHLKECPVCREQVSQWRSAMRGLAEWQLPAARPRRSIGTAALKWAVAAGLVLGIGMGMEAARALSGGAGDRAALRRELRAEMQGDLDRQHQQWLAEAMKLVDDRRAMDARATLTAIRDMNDLRQADYAALHKEMETMAVLTQTGFQEAQEQIVDLASAAQPDNPKPVH